MQEATPLLPNLRVLELIGSVDLDDFEDVLSFLHTRDQWLRHCRKSSDGSQLVELTIASRKSQSPPSLGPWLRQYLQKTGLAVNVFPHRDQLHNIKSQVRIVSIIFYGY